MDADDRERVTDLAGPIKATRLHEQRPALLPPDEMAAMAIPARQRAVADIEDLPVNLKTLRAQDRVITGLPAMTGRSGTTLALIGSSPPPGTACPTGSSTAG